MLNVSFDFPGAQLAAGFYGVSGLWQDLRPCWKDVAAVFERAMAKRFETGGRPKKWEGLSDMTKHIKETDGLPTDKPLMGKGRLRDSFVKKGASGHVREFSRLSMSIGSDLTVGNGRYVLAQLHTDGYTVKVTPRMAGYFGATYGWPLRPDSVLHTPARPVLQLAPINIERMMDVVKRYLMKTAGETFGGLAYVEGDLPR